MIDITENIIPIPPTATALGFFDGLHLGHMKVVEECFRHGGLCLLYTSPSPRDRG